MQHARPLLVARPNGRLAWQFDDGTIRPYVGGGAEGDDEKKFTQADLDRLIQERVARVKVEPPADYAQLQAAAQELATLKAADQTEAQRLQAALDKITGERDAAISERDTAKNDVATEKKRNAVLAIAGDMKAAKPDQVFALLPPDAVTIGDDGKVTGADEAVKKFLTENPHFVGSPARPKPDPAQGQRNDAKETGAAGKAEAARRFGNPAATGAQK